MATKAPTPAGQGHQGDWYVPVIGMGAGSVIGEGMQALKSQWADALRLMPGRGSLPTTESVASMAGGINAGRASVNVPYRIQEGREFEKAHESIDQALGLPKAYMEDPSMMGVPAHAFGRMVGKTKTGALLRPSEHNVGGMVPDKEVMDRVMNAGMRDKLLGFGAGVPAVTLPLPGQEQGGRHDILSRILGIDYPGWMNQRGPNVGNLSERDQLRKLEY